MSRHGLDRFFERVLAEPGDAEDSAVLSARRELSAALPHAPDEIYESEAAQSFLDRVVAEKSPAPPELVAAVTAEYAREAREPAVTDPRGRAVPRWGWAAGTVAASLAAILVGIWMAEKPVAPGHSIAPASAVASLQAPDRSDIANAVPPPLAPKPPSPDARATKLSEPVYTTANPPVALTSHAVTADDYPVDSVRLQEQGTVTLQYTIETDGTVGDCHVTKTSGFSRLDEAACVLVQKWTFKPATVIGGTPVAVTIPAEIVYALARAPNPPPALVQSGKSGVLIEGKDFNAVGVPVPPPSTPPLALSSHAVSVADYPPESVNLGEQGKVQIRYTIGTDGVVSECVVTMSSGIPRLDDGACAMVKTKWKFVPATQNGKSVAVSIQAEVVFALK
jgi:TonB family protein